MTQGRDENPGGARIADADTAPIGGPDREEVSSVLRRLAAALEPFEGGAALVDENGRILHFDAGGASRRTLGDTGVAEGRSVFDRALPGSPQGTDPRVAGGWCLPSGGGVSGAVASIGEGSRAPAYVAALAPASRIADPALLLPAALLAASALGEALRARAETARADREQACRRGVVASVPDPTILVDAAGRILDANGLAARVFGTRLTPGRPLFDSLYGSGLIDRAGLAALRSAETDSTVAVELRLGRGAQARPFLVEFSTVRDRDEVAARVIRFRSQQDAARLASGSRSLEDVERRALVLALEETRWNISETARRLGVTRPTVYSMIRRHHVSPGSR